MTWCSTQPASPWYTKKADISQYLASNICSPKGIYIYILGFFFKGSWYILPKHDLQWFGPGRYPLFSESLFKFFFSFSNYTELLGLEWTIWLHLFTHPIMRTLCCLHLISLDLIDIYFYLFICLNQWEKDDHYNHAHPLEQLGWYPGHPRPRRIFHMKVGMGDYALFFFSEHHYNSILKFLTLKLSQRTHEKCQQSCPFKHYLSWYADIDWLPWALQPSRRWDSRHWL